MHQFIIGEHHYGLPDDDWSEMSPRDERHAILAHCLSEGVTGFTYEYDFGDGWEHAIRVESILRADQVKRYPSSAPMRARRKMSVELRVISNSCT